MSSISEGDILVVEDNPYDAEMVIRSLKKHNLKNRIVHVTDGKDALDYLFCRGSFSQRKPTPVLKMVILDLNLPDMGGLEVLRSMKSDPRTKCVPVVILTSSREEQDAIEGYELGVSSYILKSTMIKG